MIASKRITLLKGGSSGQTMCVYWLIYRIKRVESLRIEGAQDVLQQGMQEFDRRVGSHLECYRLQRGILL